MMPKAVLITAILLFLFTSGCQTSRVGGKSGSPGSNKDIARAVGQVAEGITGQELTDEQKKKLVRDIQTDKDAQSALNVIADAMDMKKTVIKYCPVDGQRYNPALENCPLHNVQLEQLTK